MKGRRASLDGKFAIKYVRAFSPTSDRSGQHGDVLPSIYTFKQFCLGSMNVTTRESR